jgi:alanine racemase
MQQVLSRAWVEIDLGALKRNAALLSARAGAPLLPMVKADAYGLGAIRVARALEALDPWGFGVATVAEGAELRAAGISRPIVIFTPLLPADFDGARAHGLTPTLGMPDVLSQWTRSGGGTWHLAIDTGMSRAGIPWDRVEDILGPARDHPPEGAFTHFHSAERADGSVEKQQARFLEAIARLPVRPPLLHTENSPARERVAPSRWDLCRPGVFLYGVGGGPGAAVRPDPVAHLRARVVEIRDVPDGETVSYSATFYAEGTRRIATAAAGYADGVRRSLGNRGQALVRGARVPIAGAVTMDMTMLDVTGRRCEVGDVATFIGRDGDELLDVSTVAAMAELSPYELLVGLRLRADRVYLE